MPTDHAELIQKLRDLDRSVIDINTREQAVEWSAQALGAMKRAQAAIQQMEAQLRAAKTIVHCKDEQASHIRREYGDLRAKAADVQGERDANAILTDEVARLEAEVAALKLGNQRYETIRRLNPQAFLDAYVLNRRTGKAFDEIVDDLRPFVFPAGAGLGSRQEG